MKRKHRWTALVLVVALIASAIAPASALASRSDRPSDLPDGPGGFPMPLEYGDPDGSGSGSPQALHLPIQLRIVFIGSLRVVALFSTRPDPQSQFTGRGAPAAPVTARKSRVQ